MSEFLMIVPPEFTEIPNAAEFIAATCGEDGLSAVIANQSWWEISQFLDMVGLLLPGMGVHDARLFRTGDLENPFRFFVKWGPEL